MASVNRSTEYLYASARIRSLENTMVSKERTERILDLKNVRDVWSVLNDCGFVPLRREDGAIDREATLQSVLKNAYDTVLGIVPDAGMFRFLLYPYDCNHIKASIKAFLRGIDPSGMLFDLGTVPASEVVDMPKAQSYSALPRHMAEAAAEATEAYARTQDPQKIDTCLDRACYADMLEAANETGNPYAVELVRAKIDLTNIMMVLRLIRMNLPRTGRALLEESLLEGGKLARADLLRWYEAGESRLFDALSYGPYRAFANAVSATDGSLAQIECAADNVWMEEVREAKLIPYGFEVLVGYLLGMEYAVKNIRIILAGKDAGLSPDVIRERVRLSYV